MYANRFEPLRDQEEEEEQGAQQAEAEEDEERSSVFNYSKREEKDQQFKRVYVALMLVVYVIGLIVSFKASEERFEVLTKADSLFGTQCAAWTSASSAAERRRSLLEIPALRAIYDTNKRRDRKKEETRPRRSMIQDTIDDTNDDLDDVFDGDDFWQKSRSWLFLAIFTSFVLGVGFLYAFKNHASKATWAIVAFKVFMSFALSVWLFWSNNIVGGSIFLAVSFVIAWFFYMWREEIHLVNRLLATASKALNDQKHTLSATLGINLFVTICVVVPCVLFFTFAWTFGNIAKNNRAIADPNDAERCIDPQSYQNFLNAGSPTEDKDLYVYEVNCCEWRTDAWVHSYCLLLLFALIWTSSVANCLRLFTIAGSTSQWYFAPLGTTAFRGTVLRSFKHGINAQFGTICLGGLIMTIVEIIRNMVENARRDNRNNGLMAFVTCCVSMVWSCISEIIGFISKFAIVYAAISGASFCDSAKKASKILSDNALSTYAVWYLPSMILRTSSFVVSLVFAVVFGISSARYFDDESRTTESVLLGIFAFVIAMTILNFCLTVLLDVVDSVYLCFGIDKDLQMLTKPEIHEVLDEIVKKQPKTFVSPSAHNNRNTPQHEMSAMAQTTRNQHQVVTGYPAVRQQPDIDVL